MVQVTDAAARLRFTSAQLARLYCGVLLVLALIIVGGYGAAYAQLQGVIVANRQLSAGQAATSFILPSLTGGNDSLARFRGYPVLITFVDLTCPVSLDELDELNAWAGQRADVAVVVIVRQPLAEAAAWFANRPLTNLHLLADGQSTYAAYGAYRTPTSFVLDAAGIVRYVQSGGASKARHFDSYLQYVNVTQR